MPWYAHTSAYQGVTNISFSENFARKLNEGPLVLWGITNVNNMKTDKHLNISCLIRIIHPATKQKQLDQWNIKAISEFFK